MTGHSLGASCGLFCALDLEATWEGRLAVQMYSFGAPRVGNIVFAQMADRHLKHHWRIVNDSDLVCATPPYLVRVSGC